MTPAYTLRDYQQAGIDAIKGEFRAGHKRVLLCMPTGAGKTLTASEMVRGNFEKGKRMLWLTDREELAAQAGEAFDKADVPHAFIMAEHAPDQFSSAWVGTIQSFLAWRRPPPSGKTRWTPDTVDLIVIDEAHRTEADSFQQALAEYPDAYVVGLTATPMRGDGRGLGRTYDGMVVPITMRELLDRGVLVPARYFVPSSQDYTTLQRLKAGDYSSAELAAWAEQNPQLVGDAVENFLRVCPDRRAVAFPPDIKTSVALAERFTAAGIPAVHVDGKMKKPERRERMQAFRSGEAQVLTSVNIAIEGLDVPDVSAVLMMRPTKSERIWVQAVGRGLRSAPGKTDCVVLDHAGVLMEFGPAEDFTPPELHSKAGKQVKGSAKRERKPAEVVCDGEYNGAPCGTVLIGTNVCPTCGTETEYDPTPRHAATLPGDLEEVTGGRRVEIVRDLEEKRRWYAEFLGALHNRSKNPDRAYHLFRAKFKEKPPFAWRDDVQPAHPSAEVLAFIRSQDIAFARRQKPKEVRYGNAV